MGSEARTVNQIIDEYNAMIDDAANLNTFSRCLSHQEAKVQAIEAYVSQVRRYKHWAIRQQDEQLANLFLHFHCMLRAIQSSLSVWLTLKTKHPIDAWRHLVDAQEYADVAKKAKRHHGVEVLEEQLNAMERSLFPHQNVFNSPGFTETIGKCSVCGEPFAVCDHVEGHIYMGIFCRRVDRQILDINHSAVVANPRDRRCVFAKYSESGRMVDRFTLEDLGPSKDDGNGMLVEGVIISFKQLELD